MTSHKARKLGPVIPSTTGTLRSLTVTMAVMCYLACLAVGALILINGAVENWTKGLSGEATVQVRQVQSADIEAELLKAVALIERFGGVREVEVLDRSASARLLEPWLGTKNLDALPLPRLIRIAFDASAPPDLKAMSKELQTAVSGASLDTHRQWQSELTRMALTLSALSLGILALIALSAVAMVTFATRAVLQANRPVVELLHLVGAKDGYIARQVEARILTSGLWSGLAGVGFGVLTFLVLGLTGAGGGMSAASRSLIFAPPEIALANYLYLLMVPMVALVICLLTCRTALIRMLGSVL